jgi:oligoribonuclease NrnB/cAMP/cGMP phosphodiesterase (DHH superfamily)
MNTVKKILIIYHGECPDGFSGAWAAWKKFGKKAEYFAGRRDEPLPDVRGREVYCIDFTPEPASAVKKMARDAARLVLIDHHLTAKPKMELAPEFWFSLEHSAAVLAWEYFFPGKPVPRLLRYVEDQDIWKWKLTHSEEINEYIGLQKFDFKAWDTLAKELESAKGRVHAVKNGGLLLKHTAALMEEIMRGARLVRFGGARVLAVNSPVFDSELGHALAKKKPPFGIVWRQEGKNIRVSLRAQGNFDVAKIAEKYGGGGHRAAAGFLLVRGTKLPWK